jgi:two-component system phosphate regulon sensor histidine kinase PhoR
MNKKAIWAIIGLMSAAVIGVAVLQMDLIRTAVRVNEDRFEKNVFAALNAVNQRLVDRENREVFDPYISGYMKAYWESPNAEAFKKEASVEITQSGRLNQRRTSTAMPSTLLDNMMSEFSNTCNCQQCIERKDSTYRALMVYFQQNTEGFPLDQRIQPKHLNETLKQELANRGIDTDYNYGIYSKAKNSFIIIDGHYAVEDEHPKEVLPGYRTIYNSPYKVSLFPNDMPSPGMLMIHFPARTSFVWRSLWMNFLGAIIFTAIILFCFAYTIHVIFRQKKLSEMKTDFINNMTHEFKTPIATISLAADSITSPMVSGNQDKVQRFAGIIKQENKRMNSQVEKVLQMALIDKRDFSLNVSEVNLHDVINSAVENISLQVEKRDGIATAILEAENPIVQGDATHISNIVNNLLDNANKYSPETPEITVLTKNVPNGVEVTIQDKGMGMNKEQRKHIFDKFYRVHTGDLHDVKGFGLGLSYVKAMMTAHQGLVEVKSELGKGSSFILTFPTNSN